MTCACVGNLNENEKWIHNEAHGGLYGVYMNKDGLAGCSLIQGFFIWRSFDFGIYFQVRLRLSTDFIPQQKKFRDHFLTTVLERVLSFDSS